MLQPNQIDLALQHEKSSWLTLLTSEGYNSPTESYNSRRIVRAVLVEIMITK